MADIVWVGRVTAISEVYTLTIGGTWVANDTVTITVGGASIVLTIGATVTTAHIAAAINAAWNGSDVVDTESRSAVGSSIPQMQVASATVNGSVVTFTGRTPGVPFVMSVDKTSSSGTVSLSNTVDATGPNDVGNADNYEGNALPVNSDTLTIPAGSANLLYGLDALSGVTLSSLYHYLGVVVGLPKRNPSGYEEYLPEFLEVSATNMFVNMLVPNVQPASRVKIKVGSVQTTAIVYASANYSGIEPGFQLVGTHASNLLDIRGGTAGLSLFPGLATNIATLRVSGQSQVKFGIGGTLGVAVIEGSSSVEVMQSNFTTMTLTGSSTFTLRGTGTGTTANVRGGTFRHLGSGTISAVICGGYGESGVYSTAGSLESKSVTTLTMKQQGAIEDEGRTTFGSIVYDPTCKRMTAA